jgi:hypothetical protein
MSEGKGRFKAKRGKTTSAQGCIKLTILSLRETSGVRTEERGSQ